MNLGGPGQAKSGKPVVLLFTVTASENTKVKREACYCWMT